MSRSPVFFSEFDCVKSNKERSGGHFAKDVKTGCQTKIVERAKLRCGIDMRWGAEEHVHRWGDIHEPNEGDGSIYD